MTLFRFQDIDSPGGSGDVDAVLGLRRLDAMQWEGWCFQLSCHRGLRSPESVVEAINARIKELIRTKQGAISSGALRDGDDSRLLSDATVSGVQLQGWLYVSVTVSVRREMPQEPVFPACSAQLKS